MQNIVDLLQNSSLNRIVQRANQLNVLNHKIQQRLPLAYRNFYRIVNLTADTLTIEVQNATVKQGLQLQQHALLPLIQEDLPQVTELIFKINPNFKYK